MTNLADNAVVIRFDAILVYYDDELEPDPEIMEKFCKAFEKIVYDNFGAVAGDEAEWKWEHI